MSESMENGSSQTVLIKQWCLRSASWWDVRVLLKYHTVLQAEKKVSSR